MHTLITALKICIKLHVHETMHTPLFLLAINEMESKKNFCICASRIYIMGKRYRVLEEISTKNKKRTHLSRFSFIHTDNLFKIAFRLAHSGPFLRAITDRESWKQHICRHEVYSCPYSIQTCSQLPLTNTNQLKSVPPGQPALRQNSSVDSNSADVTFTISQ